MGQLIQLVLQQMLQMQETLQLRFKATDGLHSISKTSNVSLAFAPIVDYLVVGGGGGGSGGITEAPAVAVAEAVPEVLCLRTSLTTCRGRLIPLL